MPHNMYSCHELTGETLDHRAYACEYFDELLGQLDPHHNTIPDRGEVYSI
jgi:hypothetical protein